jgi:hypothetical protein
MSLTRLRSTRPTSAVRTSSGPADGTCDNDLAALDALGSLPVNRAVACPAIIAPARRRPHERGIVVDGVLGTVGVRHLGRLGDACLPGRSDSRISRSRSRRRRVRSSTGASPCARRCFESGAAATGPPAGWRRAARRRGVGRGAGASGPQPPRRPAHGAALAIASTTGAGKEERAPRGRIRAPQDRAKTRTPSAEVSAQARIGQNVSRSVATISWSHGTAVVVGRGGRRLGPGHRSGAASGP